MARALGLFSESLVSLATCWQETARQSLAPLCGLPVESGEVLPAP